jgi:hypothetical protein
MKLAVKNMKFAVKYMKMAVKVHVVSGIVAVSGEVS